MKTYLLKNQEGVFFTYTTSKSLAKYIGTSTSLVKKQGTCKVIQVIESI